MTEKDRRPRWTFHASEAWWGFLMAFRQFPGLRVSIVLAIVAACGAGCTAGRVPASGFQPTDQSTAKSLPGDPVAVTDSGQTAALGVPWKSASAPPPTPPSPLALAMARADSHYERGLLAMRNGKTDQAEWEFDAALETLLDTGLAPALPPRLLGTDRSSTVSLHGWLAACDARPSARDRKSAPGSGRADTRGAGAPGTRRLAGDRQGTAGGHRRGARPQTRGIPSSRSCTTTRSRRLSGTFRPANGAWSPAPSSAPAATCP